MLKGSVVIMRGNYNEEQGRMYVKKPGGNIETSTDANVVGYGT